MKLPYIQPRAAQRARGRMPQTSVIGPLLVVAEDKFALRDALSPICTSLDIDVRSVRDELGLRRLLASWDVVAVLAVAEGEAQDGYNVMMCVAEYEREMSILFLTGLEPVLAGAAEAIQELCQLTNVALYTELPGPGIVAEFLCNAVRLANGRGSGAGVVGEVEHEMAV